MFSPEIRHLLTLFNRLPGLGPRSARRICLHLLKNKDKNLLPLIQALSEAHEKLKTCQTCFNLDVDDPCSICEDEKRQNKTLCIVEDVSDLWALERSNVYRGQYHILGGVLSAIDGMTPQKLNIESLKSRLETKEYEEVILALNTTIDGQTTQHFIAEICKDYDVKISSLANGVPIGGELDYLDEGTLFAAFERRNAA